MKSRFPTRPAENETRFPRRRARYLRPVIDDPPTRSLVRARVLECHAAGGLEEVEAEEWNALADASQAPLRHGYASAWQHAELPGLRLRPLLLRDAETGVLVAGTPAYFYDLDMGVVHSPFLADALAQIRRVAPRLLITRVFELGSATPRVTPFAVSPEVDEGTAVDEILRAALHEAWRGGAQLVIAQNFERSVSEATERALRRHGFAPVPIPQTAGLELPFDSFDEYLDSMRAQYRRRARKALKASSHLHVEHVRDFDRLVPELARLWRLVYDRADEVKREILADDFFQAVAAVDTASVLVLRRDDDSIAAYAMLLDDEPRLHFLYTGFEREAGEQECAYFRLLYEIVRYAIEHGFGRVNLGLTTLEPKLDVGAVPVPLYAWMRHRRPHLHRLFVGLGQGPFAPRPVQPRHVFKS